MGGAGRQRLEPPGPARRGARVGGPGHLGGSTSRCPPAGGRHLRTAARRTCSAGEAASCSGGARGPRPRWPRRRGPSSDAEDLDESLTIAAGYLDLLAALGERAEPTTARPVRPCCRCTSPWPRPRWHAGGTTTSRAHWEAASAEADRLEMCFPGAYARFRLAEVIVRAGGSRAEASVELAEAHRRATRDGSGAAPPADHRAGPSGPPRSRPVRDRRRCRRRRAGRGRSRARYRA